VLDALTVPPRLIVRALDDLHTLAQGVRRLTDRDGDLDALLDAVKALPRTEDELSANIAALRDDLKGLQVWLQPLHKEADRPRPNGRGFGTVNEQPPGDAQEAARNLNLQPEQVALRQRQAVRVAGTRDVDAPAAVKVFSDALTATA
jgi:hypothetical protein